MNFYQEKLNQIKVILGLEVKLASEKLVDGTVVEAENFEPGFPLFVIAADGTKSLAPAGTHELESGAKVEVDQEGKIVSIEEKETEAPKVEVEVEAAAEDTVPASETPEEIAKKEASVTEAMKKMVMAVEEIAKDSTPKYTREPFPLPTFDCPALDEIPHTTFDELVFKLQPADFYMDDYQSHPTIKAPLSN